MRHFTLLETMWTKFGVNVSQVVRLAKHFLIDEDGLNQIKNVKYLICTKIGNKMYQLMSTMDHTQKCGIYLPKGTHQLLYTTTMYQLKFV